MRKRAFAAGHEYDALLPEDRPSPDRLLRLQYVLDGVAMWTDHAGQDRAWLLTVCEGKGWILLAYKSAEQFARDELNLSRQHLDRLLSAASIERDLQLPVGVHLPESHLRELRVLETAEQRRKAYGLAREMARTTIYPNKAEALTGKLTATIMRRAVLRVQGKEQPEEQLPIADRLAYCKPTHRLILVVQAGNTLRTASFDKDEVLRVIAEGENDVND